MQGEIAGDRYQIVKPLGHGGMASVFLARDPRLGREVAVKLLADNLADDRDARRRFEREARLAAKLDHPNVVQVFDVGEEDGRPFIVMEHVDGGTLADLIQRRRPVPRRRQLDLLRQASAGLAHAHGQGLVHRDVKPQNLLLRRDDGRLKIADFGIARAAEEAAVTRTGQVLGTEPYMAPEQLEGADPSPASDVYALGVVGRKLLGRRAAGDLDALLEKCTAPDPRDRFRDAAELRDALEEIEADGTAADRGATTVPLTKSRSRGEVTAPTARRGATAPTRRLPDQREIRLPAALLALFAVAVVALILVLSSGGDDPGGAGDAVGGADAGSKVEPAPRVDDPEQQARALADWIRDQAR